MVFVVGVEAFVVDGVSEAAGALDVAVWAVLGGEVRTDLSEGILADFELGAASDVISADFDLVADFGALA